MYYVKEYSNECMWIEVSGEELEKVANRCHVQEVSWHFHLLTPLCCLNRRPMHAFIVENSTDNQVYVSYSEKPNMILGKKLLALLHGITVGTKEQKSETTVSTDVQTIVDRAITLTEKGKFWHHHMLLPSCIFNESGKFVIMFEDQEKEIILKALSDSEPKDSLSMIESLYYKQKNLT
jgi:hypothetical protein